MKKTSVYKKIKTKLNLAKARLTLAFEILTIYRPRTKNIKQIEELKRHQFQLETQIQALKQEKIQLKIELQNSDQRYQTLATIAPVGIFHVDYEGNALYVNKAWSQITGLTTEILKDKGWTHAVHPDDKIIAYQEWRRTTQYDIPYKRKLRFIHNDGKITWVLAQVSAIKNAKDIPIGHIGSLTDITKHCETEAQLSQQQQKLAHLSRLHTAGEMILAIAHEINQPLAAISHYTAGCLERLRDTTVSQEIIQVMQRVVAQAEHAGAIVHRLKNFLRTSEMKKTTVPINIVIQETIDFIEYQLKSANIKLYLHLDERSPDITVDKLQIQQVLLNLTQNAIDAMTQTDHKHHALTIKTFLCKADKINIIIRDTGCGIPADSINKLFDPFFTTKSNGVGMGLAIARSIIEAHNGHINIAHGEKVGTTFHLSLPRNN